MIIQLENSISSECLDAVKTALGAFGCRVTEVSTQRGHYLVALRSREFDLRSIGHMNGVRDVHLVKDAAKLVSRKWKVGRTVIVTGCGAAFGGETLTIIAGPCAIESSEQMEKVAAHLASNGVNLMRGGAFKPRSSPYSFRGLGLEGLKMCHAIAQRHQIGIVAEVVTPADIEAMYPYVDIYQVGTRNSQNFDLLSELGRVDKPVLLKRGMSGTVEELLQSAEYIFSSGNEDLILCERGIRTYEKSYRNTLDLNAVPVLRERSHLPVVVDPSHGVGVRRFVPPMALAAVAAGADGLLLEVHEKPEEALSDAQQTLSFDESRALIKRARRLFDLCRSREMSSELIDGTGN